MPVKGINQVNRALDRVSDQICEAMLQKGLYIAATVGAGYATLMTPVDTSNLINSQYIKVNKGLTGSNAVVGYTANYAAAVHGKKGTLKGKPRANGNGNYWTPDAEPLFLTKGFEQNYKEVNNAFFRAMKL